jgi:hypothetical protein
MFQDDYDYDGNPLDINPCRDLGCLYADDGCEGQCSPNHQDHSQDSDKETKSNAK